MKKDSKLDRVFEEVLKIEDFKFDDKVARVFDDMLNRSVPLYTEAQMMALSLALNFVQKGANIYDLGCSTGTLLKTLSGLIPDKTVKLIGFDNSASMLEQARKKIIDAKAKERIELRLADIGEEMEIENASVVIMNYTLQFVRPLHRASVVKRIFEGINKNGCFILVEKVLGNDSLFNRLYIELYYDYKRGKGYSDKEITQKREALENVLIPYRADENIKLLKETGFGVVDIFFKWFNFAGFVAVKS